MLLSRNVTPALALPALLDTFQPEAALGRGMYLQRQPPGQMGNGSHRSGAAALDAVILSTISYMGF